MNKALRGVALLTALGIVISLPSAVRAENCWMVGCVGRVGYIFLPETVHPPDGGRVRYTQNRHDCGDPNVGRPFGTSGLPDVNAVVPLAGDGNAMFSQGQIETHLGSFQAPTIEHGNDGLDCQVVWRRPLDASGDPIKAGAKVKILGYRTFVNETSRTGDFGVVTFHEQILFALVLVESDF